MINPLLTSFTLPNFNAIYPEHIVPAIKKALDYCYQTVEEIIKQPGPFTWSNLCQPLAEADNRLCKIWSPINHLNAVKNSHELREAYEQSLPLISAYGTWIGQHQGLYQAYCNLRSSQYYIQLSAAQQKAIDNTLQNFKLSGIGLSVAKQQRYGEIITKLSELESRYNNNVLDATMSWSKLITNEQELFGIPKSTLAAARAQAQAHKKEGWLLTLDTPSYLSVLTHCENVTLRKEFYRAYNTRASDQWPNGSKWDNSYVINEIIKLRHELAQLIGFDNYANKSLVTKMAQHPQQVLDFLTNLTKRVRPQGKQELAQLQAFTKKYFNQDTLEPWDIAYYSEKQKQQLFSINDEQLRPYFPESQVINGMFEVVKRIYGITLKERTNVDTWHTTVRFFELFDEHNELRGSFYLDLYTRDNKRGGAWMDGCVSMMRKANGELQKPVAYIICNFNRQINNTQILLTHHEVITLFHEFGHGLHHIMTSIDTPGVAGINGVPWDAVELPSQLMENYCWQTEALTFISGHYETGAPLPDEMLDKILATKNYQVALFILRQLELSLFDFYIHYHYHHEQGARILETMATIKEQVTVTPTMPWVRFPHTFSHIFAGGYAAGYYSYLWAEVLAADTWSRFEEEGIFNQDTGKSFLNEVLSRGGSEDLMTLFVRFRGRKPQLNAMLRLYGFQENNQPE